MKSRSGWAAARRAAAPGWSPQNPDALAILSGRRMASDLEHAGVEGGLRGGPHRVGERPQEDRPGVARLNDRVYPAARGAVPDVGLVGVVPLHPLAERVELLRA